MLLFKKIIMPTKNRATKTALSKKEFKKELAGKLEPALAELKNTLGDKEFHHRLKKAAKILIHGLHTKDLSGKTNGSEKAIKKTTPKKIKGVKQVKAKDTEVSAS